MAGDDARLGNQSSLGNQRQTLGVLGPVGSFTDAASRKVNYRNVYFKSYEEIFMAFDKGVIDAGLVAIENQLAGTVVSNLDLLAASDCIVIGEIQIPISHCIASLDAKDKITTVYSHPQGFAQCSTYLKSLCDIQKITTESTSEGFRMIAESNMDGCAAIGPRMAAERYRVPIIKDHIEDFKNNVTRFFIITKKMRSGSVSDSSGNAVKKTSIVFSTSHKPGALFSCLEPFRDNSVNLTKIESRPIPEEDWEYLFYLDFEHNKPDDVLAKTLDELRQHTITFRILGSYKVILYDE